MNRQTFWMLFCGLALAVLAAAWFFAHYDRVPTDRWEKPGREALRDPYLALERLSARLGRPLTRLAKPADLERLPPGGVLLLDQPRRLYLNARRTEDLFRWVREGGYLIVAAEDPTVDDPVLKRLGVMRCEPDSGETPTDESEAAPPDAEDKPGQAGRCVPAAAGEFVDEPVSVPVPGAERPLQLKPVQSTREHGLVPTTPAPAWPAGVDQKSAVVLHYAYGAGQVTVLESFAFLSNWQIGEYDHAELLWTLAGHYQPRGGLHLATRLEVPSLWRWLGESAWMALLSGGLLIAAWLWAIVPRFGGILPAPQPDRRSLAEHLAAVGRAVWREGGLTHWSALVRQDLRETLFRRHPHLAALSRREQADFLAGSTGIPAGRLLDLFDPEGEVSPEAFAERVRTAQQLLKKT